MTEVEERLRTHGTTEFVTRDGDDLILCVSYAFGHPSVLTYYYIFRNDRLAKVIERPPFEYETLLITEGEFKGSKEGRRKPVDPLVRLRRVMKADDLDESGMRASLLKNLQIVQRRTRGMEPDRIDAALTATAPLRAALAPLLVAEAGRREQLARRFDARAMVLDVNRKDLNDHFGDVKVAVTPESGQEILVYGAPIGDELDGGEILSWVVIEMRNGRVVRAFNHDFVDVRFIDLLRIYK